MKRARRLALTGAVLVGVGLGAWSIPIAQALTTAPATATGWWTRQPLAQPVADDGFEVAWAAEQEQSMAAVRVDFSAAAGATVQLALKEAGGNAADQGGVVVCVTTDAWAPANPGSYADHPEADCEAGPSVELSRDADATEWTGDVTSLAGSGGSVSLVVRPIGKPLGDGSPASAPFSVQFAQAELRFEAASAPGPVTEDTTAPPSYDVGEGGASSDPGYSYPDLGTGLEAPVLPPVAPPAAVTDTTLAPAPDDEFVLGPVDVSADGGRPWGRLLVLTPLSAGLGTLAAAGRRWQLDRAMARGHA